MSDSKYFKDLLEKYWNCETSVEEEYQLKQYYQNGQVDSEMVPFKSFFTSLDDLSNIKMEKPLESLMPRSTVKSLNVRSWVYAAATFLALGFIATWMINPALLGKSSMVEVKDPQEALAITKEALSIFSNTVNTGSETVEISVSHIENINLLK